MKSGSRIFYLIIPFGVKQRQIERVPYKAVFPRQYLAERYFSIGGV